jgi:hypothetical protein
MFTVDFVEPDVHLNNRIKGILPFITEEKIRYILSYESYMCGLNDSFDRINPDESNYARTRYKIDPNVATPNDISLDIRRSTIRSLITENAKYTQTGHMVEIGHPHAHITTYYQPANIESRTLYEMKRFFVNPYVNFHGENSLQPINPTAVGLNLHRLPGVESIFRNR